MFDQTKERRRINRMMRELPIRQVKAKPAAPLPALHLPENWLAQRRFMKLDRAVTVLLLALTALLLALAVDSVARAEDQPPPMYVTVSGGSRAYTGDGYVPRKHLQTQEGGSTLPGEPASES